MMFSLLLKLLLVVQVAFVASNPLDKRDNCITTAQAKTFVSGIESLYTSYSAANADKWLTVDFTAYSYSMLRPAPGKMPSGDVVASSRAQFEQIQAATQKATGGLPPFKTLKIWHGCDTVTFWWTISISGTGGNVLFTGLDVLEIDVAKMKIKASYNEYSQ